MPAYHESNDFPLQGPGNKDPRVSKPHPVMDVKGRRYSAKNDVLMNEDREQKLLQDLKRDNGNLRDSMNHCKTE